MKKLLLLTVPVLFVLSACSGDDTDAVTAGITGPAPSTLATASCSAGQQPSSSPPFMPDLVVERGSTMSDDAFEELVGALTDIDADGVFLYAALASDDRSALFIMSSDATTSGRAHVIDYVQQIIDGEPFDASIAGCAA